MWAIFIVLLSSLKCKNIISFLLAYHHHMLSQQNINILTIYSFPVNKVNK